MQQSEKSRVASDVAGYRVTVTTQSGSTVVGCVQPDGDGWKSFWADGNPLTHFHATADEGIESFLGAARVAETIA